MRWNGISIIGVRTMRKATSRVSVLRLPSCGRTWRRVAALLLVGVAAAVAHAETGRSLPCTGTSATSAGGIPPTAVPGCRSGATTPRLRRSSSISGVGVGPHRGAHGQRSEAQLHLPGQAQRQAQLLLGRRGGRRRQRTPRIRRPLVAEPGGEVDGQRRGRLEQRGRRYRVAISRLHGWHLRLRLRGLSPFRLCGDPSSGGCLADATVDSSFHVLWKTSQRPPGSNDSDPVAHVFVADGASDRYASSRPDETRFLYAEWEPKRALPGELSLPVGSNAVRIFPTEESFHENTAPPSSGRWATVMTHDDFPSPSPRRPRASTASTTTTTGGSTSIRSPFPSPGTSHTLPSGAGDPGCFNPAWFTESPQCQDGIDNDGDGWIDYDGGLSALGYVAADSDPQCSGKSWRNKEVEDCGLGIELTLLLAPLMWLFRGAVAGPDRRAAFLSRRARHEATASRIPRDRSGRTVSLIRIGTWTQFRCCLRSATPETSLSVPPHHSHRGGCASSHRVYSTRGSTLRRQRHQGFPCRQTPRHRPSWLR